MNECRLLLASSCPAVQNFFSRLGQSDHPPFAVNQIPVAVEALAGRADQVATATVAAVEVTLDPAAALHVCQELRRQRPSLPAVALVCCPRPVTFSYVQALLAAGVRSVLSLDAPTADIVRALHGVARGEAVFRFQLARERGAAREEIAEGRQPDQGVPAPRPLTEGDAQLLELVAYGLTDQEIADQLNLSPHTVKHYIEHLRERVGAKNRAALAGWSAHHGFYRPAPVTAGPAVA